MRMPSPMKASHAFSQVPSVRTERSVFDRSHGYKTTFDAVKLVPVYYDEVLPGDTFTMNASGFIRLATPIKPIMDNFHVDIHFFFVPWRLVWTNFVKMMGEQKSPGDSTSYTVPQMTCGGADFTAHSLHDYFGMPLAADVSGTYSATCLYHRAYHLIFNEWYRDENLFPRQYEQSGDGPDTSSSYLLQNRNKRHDYFTSALPWTQKGTGVSLPLGSTAPVIEAGDGEPSFKAGDGTNFITVGAVGKSSAKLGSFTAQGAVRFRENATGNPSAGADEPSALNKNLRWNDPKLQADLSSATAASINQIRQAFQIQKYLERDARGGTRYTEKVKAHFGVTSPDARLQRPEFLGGNRASMFVSPIAQNSGTNAQPTPQGNLAGIGTCSFTGAGFAKSFTEHGCIIGIVSVWADLTYQQGLDRLFSRSTQYDFAWPEFAHLGEQAVLNKEIYCKGDANDALVFGYQERHAEYRYKPSRITGKFRSTYATTLDIWHLSEKFTALPTLGQSFIGAQPPVARVLAVPTEPHFIGDFYFKLKCARPLPVFGTPGFIDHF